MLFDEGRHKGDFNDAGRHVEYFCIDYQDHSIVNITIYWKVNMKPPDLIARLFLWSSSPVNLQHIFRTLFLKNISGRLLLITVYYLFRLWLRWWKDAILQLGRVSITRIWHLNKLLKNNLLLPIITILLPIDIVDFLWYY